MVCAAEPKTSVVLDGKGFNYASPASISRAIVQFNPEVLLTPGEPSPLPKELPEEVKKTIRNN